MTSNSQRTIYHSAGFLLAVLMLSAVLFKNRAFFHDDAFITLRYALNLAQTGLPQWNPGEWVEGYTSLLHMVFSAGLIRLGIPPVSAAHAVNGASALALIFLTWIAALHLRPAGQDWMARFFTVLTVAATPSIAIWVLGGLEAVMVAALLMAGLTCLLADLERPRKRMIALAALAFSCAVLTRLDASVFVAGSGLGLLLAGGGTRARRLGMSVLVVGIPAAVAFVQMGIRLSVYGEAFPLTFYAKADLPALFRIKKGLRYTLGAFTGVPVLSLALLLGLISLALRKVSASAWMIGTPIALQTAYLVWAGGDHMPAYRMLVPLIAPAALLILALGAGFSPFTARAATALAAAASIVLAVKRPPELMDSAALVGGIIGHYIDETWPQDITVGLNTAGSTPYFARENRVFIDMLGLNDPIIAKRTDVPMRAHKQNRAGHTKGDGAYVLSREPDMIIVGPAAGVGTDMAHRWFLTGMELAEAPEFQRCYEKVYEDVPFDAKIAAGHLKVSNPLRFTYYRRTCAKSRTLDDQPVSSDGKSTPSTN